MLKYFGQPLDFSIKESQSNIVTKADLKSDSLISRLISDKFPSHNIISEESGFTNKNSEYTWVIDPLDGTSNFASAVPWFGVLITLLQNSVPIMGGAYLPVSKISLRAFDSVAADEPTGLVICEAAEGRTRVDWGFCDAIRKTGLCLMPSLLRWRAAQQLSAVLKANGQNTEAKRLQAAARKLQAALAPTFYHAMPDTRGRKTGCLFSATGLGRKDDLWAAAFALWLDVLPRDINRAVARHLLALYEAGGTVFEGQVRHLPPTGELGGHWEQSLCPAEEYQNGGFWGTPTGWLITAIRRVDARAADRLLAEYVAHLRANEAQGAPWEWIYPTLQRRVNPLYASSAGLVYIALTTR